MLQLLLSLIVQASVNNKKTKKKDENAPNKRLNYAAIVPRTNDTMAAATALYTLLLNIYSNFNLHNV